MVTRIGLEPVTGNIDDILKKAANYHRGGESEQHRTFKEFISRNPGVLKLNPAIGFGITEYRLPSADMVDILFTEKDLKIGVEVKSEISDTDDICRGLFQCVKYKSLIEAEQIVHDEWPNCRVILALQGPLPPALLIYKNLLGVEVIDNLKSAQYPLSVVSAPGPAIKSKSEDSGMTMAEQVRSLLRK